MIKKIGLYDSKKPKDSCLLRDWYCFVKKGTEGVRLAYSSRSLRLGEGTDSTLGL
ncbi:MAG: hypothetical protein PVH99_11610 [Desulfobacteraceae bacterium]|jgi:hypothetical protein